MEHFSLVIVEDDSIIAADIESSLSNSGFNIIGNFTSGKKLLNEIQPPYPDAALMDIRIDGSIDGIETAKELSEHFNIPTIFLTAHSDSQTLNRAIGSKPLGYITKPFAREDLIETINSTLSRNKLERSRIEYQKHLEKELQRHMEDLELINKLNTASFEGKGLHDICILASDGIRNIFSSFGSTVYTLNEAQDILNIVNSSFSMTMRKRIEGFFKSELPSPRLSLNKESIYKEVVTKRKSILLTNSDKIETLIREAGLNISIKEKKLKKFYLKMIPGLIKILKLKSIVLIPLISEQKVCGTILIPSQNILSESDLKRLENISNQLGVNLLR